jgi:hypothetical protein
MSFATFKVKPFTRKVTLFEVDLSEIRDLFLNDEPGIWKWKYQDYAEGVTCNFMNGCFCYGPFKEENTGDYGSNDIYKTISSLMVDKERYIRVTTQANLRASNKSFLFDPVSTIVYVHFDNFDSYSLFSIVEFGVPDNYSTEDIYLNDQFYDGRITSLPNLSKKKDPLTFGVIQYGGGTIGLDNKDGMLDRLGDRNIFGHAARLKVGGGDLLYADYLDLWNGLSEDVEITTEKCFIRLKDARAQFARSLPINVFDIATYPNIKDRNANKPIPIAYGPIVNAPVMCTNEAEGAPANYAFKICDTTYHSIKAQNPVVKVDGVEKAEANFSPDNATFTLALADYSPGKKVTVDFLGYDDSILKDGSGDLIQNGLDEITDAFKNYLDITYNADTYDTVEWVAARANVKNSAIWIDKKKTLAACIIEKVCLSNLGYFLVKNDGKYTFRIPDETADAVIKIEQDEQIEDPSCAYPTEEYLSRLVIKYNQDQAEDEYEELPDISGEEDTFKIFGIYREQEFETALIDSGDAQDLASRILAYCQQVPPIFEVKTKIAPIEQELLDNVIARINRVNKTWFGLIKAELVGLKYDLTAFEIVSTLRFIQSEEEVGLYPDGHWAADAGWTFPGWLGGGDATVWNKNWTLEQKVYAKTHFGYWVDDTGYIDPLDSESYMGSSWAEY